MDIAERMLANHPRPELASRPDIAECIEACFDCSIACTMCADACLAEERHLHELVKCIRLNLDCAAVCEVTGKIIARRTEGEDAVLKAQLEACVEACRACMLECERHATDMEHCLTCAVSCRTCAEACERILAAVLA